MRMRAYAQTTYQLVWATKYRQPVMDKRGRKRLFAFVKDVCERRDGEFFGGGGVEDHLHIVCHIPPKFAVSEFVKQIKVETHEAIDGDPTWFPAFAAWQRGFAAITYGTAARDDLAAYAQNQEAHHADGYAYRDELRRLLEENLVEVRWDYFDRDISE